MFNQDFGIIDYFKIPEAISTKMSKRLGCDLPMGDLPICDLPNM